MPTFVESVDCALARYRYQCLLSKIWHLLFKLDANRSMSWWPQALPRWSNTQVLIPQSSTGDNLLRKSALSFKTLGNHSGLSIISILSQNSFTFKATLCRSDLLLTFNKIDLTFLLSEYTLTFFTCKKTALKNITPLTASTSRHVELFNHSDLDQDPVTSDPWTPSTMIELLLQCEHFFQVCSNSFIHMYIFMNTTNTQYQSIVTRL